MKQNNVRPGTIETAVAIIAVAALTHSVHLARGAHKLICSRRILLCNATLFNITEIVTILLLELSQTRYIFYHVTLPQKPSAGDICAHNPITDHM